MSNKIPEFGSEIIDSSLESADASYYKGGFQAGDKVIATQMNRALYNLSASLTAVLNAINTLSSKDADYTESDFQTLSNLTNKISDDLKDISSSISKSEMSSGNNSADLVDLEVDNINSNLIPSGDGSKELGGSDKRWKNIYLSNNLYLNNKDLNTIITETKVNNASNADKADSADNVDILREDEDDDTTVNFSIGSGYYTKDLSAGIKNTKVNNASNADKASSLTANTNNIIYTIPSGGSGGYPDIYYNPGWYHVWYYSSLFSYSTDKMDCGLVYLNFSGYFEILLPVSMHMKPESSDVIYYWAGASLYSINNTITGEKLVVGEVRIKKNDGGLTIDSSGKIYLQKVNLI